MSLIDRLELEDYQRKLRSLTNLTKKLEKELQESRILFASLKEEEIDQKTRFLISQLEGVGGKEVQLKIILGIIKNLKNNLLKYSYLTENQLKRAYDSLIENELKNHSKKIED